MIIKSQWREQFNGELTKDLLTAHFPAERNFRVSEFTYPVGAEFDGSMLPGYCYVRAGSISYTFGEESIEVNTGECAELPGGKYHAAVLESEVSLFLVWHFDQPIRQKQKTD